MNYKKLLYLVILLSFLIIVTLMIYPLIFNSHNMTADNNYDMNMDSNSNLSYNNWTYDKNEYPGNNYTLDEICPPHTNPDIVRKFFDESDFNNDGYLTGNEISAMDYKLKHSQYTYNGPYGYN